jgi:hypothetical protein
MSGRHLAMALEAYAPRLLELGQGFDHRRTSAAINSTATATAANGIAHVVFTPAKFELVIC